MVIYKAMVLMSLFIFHSVSLANNLNQSIHIELKDKVLFGGSEFRLKDIAHIKSNIKSISTDILGEIVIGLSPRVGYSTPVRQLDVNVRVEKMFPQIGKYIKWDGPTTTILQTTGVVLDKSKYIFPAESALNNFLADNFDIYEIKQIGKLKDIYIPNGHLRIKPRNIKRSDIGKRTCVWVDLYIQEEIYQGIPVWFDVKIIENAYITRYPIKKWEVINLNMLINRDIDISKVEGVPITHQTVLLDKRVKVSLHSNQVITEQHLEVIPLVQKNNDIVIVVYDRNVQIQVKGTALEDGEMSDLIKVRSKFSEQDINAIVVAKNRVEVK
ncbi:MAG: flagellar basal body P-ring formation chaperone FlgA [Candidatus Thiodiazotropha sp. (ex Dulcina madagascariensis)]|nr:flagellar basal body P-ring formation chaperone FlgA [Candidatus Thiodiazotropha sp. (ex Dulcina madagascariensis)]MCU7925832.1 flagellar basal body P-ring formation chaperone FlgA [Candidatus Thiodiazotropha sp. (ex Dulcina madagascariensis)]